MQEDIDIMSKEIEKIRDRIYNKQMYENTSPNKTCKKASKVNEHS